MKTYRFDKSHSWTSYPVSGEYQEAIDASNYDEFPTIRLPDGAKIDPLEEYRFCERRTSAGYAVIQTVFGEIRIKVDREASPNYNDRNGNGECSSTMTIRSAISGLIFSPKSL